MKILVALIAFFCLVNAASDSVVSLPGIGAMKTNTYSGFLPTSNTSDGFLYYFFVESFNKLTDPVILWLQGGPGCGSTFGAFVENGPYIIDGEGNWSFNQWNWARNASMLWIDNPVGSGFSYTTDNKYDHTEKVISEQLVHVLEGFFSLHNEYANNPFYVFGESYAGKYVPWLAKTILSQGLIDKSILYNSSLHINGIGLGDGWVSPVLQTPTNHQYLYKMNRISLAEKEASDIFVGKYLDLLMQNEYIKASKYDNSWARILCLQGNVSNPYNINQPYDFSDPPNNAMIAWFSNQDVRNALNVPNANFSSGRNAYNALNHDEEKNALPELSYVVDRIPVLLYNGHLDFVCNYIGTKMYASVMNWTGRSGYNRQKEKSWSLSTGQKAGYYQSYGNLTRLVLYNTGHIAPFDSPQATFEMLYNWINSAFGLIFDRSRGLIMHQHN